MLTQFFIPGKASVKEWLGPRLDQSGPSVFWHVVVPDIYVR